MKKLRKGKKDKKNYTFLTYTPAYSALETIMMIKKFQRQQLPARKSLENKEKVKKMPKSRKTLIS